MIGAEADIEICVHKLRQWEESSTSVWLIKNVHVMWVSSQMNQWHSEQTCNFL